MHSRHSVTVRFDEPQLHTDHIIQATIHGMGLANRICERWTKKYWICDLGIESFVSSKIAEEVDNYIQALGLSGYTLYPEATLNGIFDEDSLRANTVRYVSETQRCDLAIIGPDEDIQALVEIKRRAAMNGLYKDIMTLADIVGGVYANQDTAPVGISCVFLDAAPGSKSRSLDEIVDNTQTQIAYWFSDEIMPAYDADLGLSFVEGPTTTFHSSNADLAEWHGWTARPLCTVIERT